MAQAGDLLARGYEDAGSSQLLAREPTARTFEVSFAGSITRQVQSQGSFAV